MDDQHEGEDSGQSKDRGLHRDERFRKVVEERNQLRDQLAERERAIQELTERAATADTLAQQVKKLEKALGDERESRQREAAMLEAGLTDPEDREIAEFQYNKLPASDRPPISDVLKGWMSDPAKAPKALRGLWDKGGETKAASTAATETKAADQAQGAKGGVARTSRTVDPDSASSAHREPLSADKLREIRTQAQKSGDWSEWKRVTGRGDAAAR